MRLLFVDDEDLLREVLQEALRLTGHEVEGASDGMEALRLLRAGKRYDAAVIDLRMPRTGGLELCDILRRDGFHMPIVITGGGMSEDECGALGVESILLKPFAVPDLLAAVTRAVAAHRNDN